MEVGFSILGQILSLRRAGQLPKWPQLSPPFFTKNLLFPVWMSHGQKGLFPPVDHRPYNCMVLGSSILSWESQRVPPAAVGKPAGASDCGQVQAGA